MPFISFKMLTKHLIIIVSVSFFFSTHAYDRTGTHIIHRKYYFELAAAEAKPEKNQTEKQWDIQLDKRKKVWAFCYLLVYHEYVHEKSKKKTKSGSLLNWCLCTIWLHLKWVENPGLEFI